MQLRHGGFCFMGAWLVAGGLMSACATHNGVEKRSDTESAPFPRKDDVSSNDQDASYVQGVHARCDEGIAEECESLGEMYLYGYRVPSDREVASRYYMKASAAYTDRCADQEWLACYYLGRLYLAGKGVAEHVFYGAHLMSQACDNGSILVACHALADLLWHGNNVRQDMKRAVGLFSRVCSSVASTGRVSLGNDELRASACVYVAAAHRLGFVQNRDPACARILFRHACFLGQTAGCRFAKGERISEPWGPAAAAEGAEPTQSLAEGLPPRAAEVDACLARD